MRRRLLTFALIALVGCTEAQFAGGDDGGTADLGPDGLDAAMGDLGSGTDLGPPPDLGPIDMGPPDMPPDLGPCDPCRPGPGDLVISEVMPDTDVVSDDDGEWFEIHNPSETVTYDLQGCVLADQGNSHPVTTETLVPPGAFFSLARFDTAAGGFDPDYSYGMTLKFSNEGDIARITCGADIIDVVDFTTWFINKGLSYALDPDALDAELNDDRANWCVGQDPYHMGGGETDFGSPGMENPDCL